MPVAAFAPSRRYFCARLLECGVILPPRHLEDLHEALYQRELAAGMLRATATGMHPRHICCP